MVGAGRVRLRGTRHEHRRGEQDAPGGDQLAWGTFQARAGPNRAEGEIKMFDDEVHSAVGKGNGLVNVLAVDLDMGHDYGERVTIARIHAKTGENTRPVVRMVRFA